MEGFGGVAVAVMIQQLIYVEVIGELRHGWEEIKMLQILK